MAVCCWAWAATFFWVGLRQFSGRQRIQWCVIWLLPAAVLVLGVVTGFPLQNLTRAGFFHAAAPLVLAVCTFDTLRDRRHEPPPSRMLLASFAGTEWQHLCPAAGVHRFGYRRIGWFRVGLLCADALSLWHRAGCGHLVQRTRRDPIGAANADRSLDRYGKQALAGVTPVGCPARQKCHRSAGYRPVQTNQ